jgi:hypothetical protein
VSDKFLAEERRRIIIRRNGRKHNMSPKLSLGDIIRAKNEFNIDAMKKKNTISMIL